MGNPEEQTVVNVDPALVDQLAKRIDDAQSHIGTVINRVKTIREELVSSGAWKGLGSGAFQTVQSEWESNGAKLNGALEQIEAGLKSNRAGLSQGDEDAGAAVRRAGTSEPLNIPGA